MPSYTFGPFSLDPEARVLLRDGAPVPLAGKTFETLLVLVQNRGRLVDKDELLAKVWPGTVVEEGNLSQSIFAVRKALGDSPKDHRYISTVAGRGYQFVARVTEVTGTGQPEMDERAKAHELWRGKRIVQFGAVAVALAVIATGWFALHRPAQPVSEMTQRRLTFNSSENPVESAVISPDGHYLAYSDGAGIHVKLLSTGEERLVPTPGGMPAGTLSYIDSWFPDGTQLLAHSRQPDDHTSMWTISVMGQSPRELRRDAVGWAVSPDGTRIAFSPSQPFKNFREIWVMSGQGEKLRKILGTAANESLWSVQWSPDGQHLAYVRAQYLPDKFLQFVGTSDLNGLSQTAVVVASDVDPWVQDLAWLPGGRIIYSQRESSDSNDANLWQIAVDAKQGRPIGKPKRMTRWAGANLQGLSPGAGGRRMIFRKTTMQTQVLLGKLSSAGTLVNPPSGLTNDEANDSVFAWTADSKAVILVSDRNGRPGLFKQAMNQDTAEPLATGPNAIDLARVSTDGRWAVYGENLWSPGAGHFPPYRLMRIPVNGGLPQFVLKVRKGIADFSCAKAPASRCVFLETSEDEKHLLLTAFDPLNGKGELLRTIDIGDYASELSPDGLTYALARRGEAEIRIRLLSLSGGVDREITVPGRSNIMGLDWSADGNGFYCGSTSPQLSTLLHVDLHGNAQTLWHERATGAPFTVGIPSPDGRYLAIWSHIRDSNAWMLEDF